MGNGGSSSLQKNRRKTASSDVKAEDGGTTKINREEITEQKNVGNVTLPEVSVSVSTPQPPPPPPIKVQKNKIKKEESSAKADPLVQAIVDNVFKSCFSENIRLENEIKVLKEEKAVLEVKVTELEKRLKTVPAGTQATKKDLKVAAGFEGRAKSSSTLGKPSIEENQESVNLELKKLQNKITRLQKSLSEAKYKNESQLSRSEEEIQRLERKIGNLRRKHGEEEDEEDEQGCTLPEEARNIATEYLRVKNSKWWD